MTFLTLFTALSLILFFFSTTPTSHSAVNYNKISETHGFQTKLMHVDHDKNLSKIELLQVALDRDSKRLKWLSRAASRLYTGNTNFPVLNSPEIGSYVINLSIGTPPTSLSLILDTGSSLVWTQCVPCHSCAPQSSPMFNPNKSHSYSKLRCSSDLCRELNPEDRPSCAEHPCGECIFNNWYGDGSNTQGNLATETLWLGNNESRRIPFGCAFINTGDLTNSSGIVGIGGVNISLVHQFSENKFSYCLPKIDSNQIGLFSVGNQVITPPGAITTNLIKNPHKPDNYFLSLEKICIGGIPLAINKDAFRILEDGSGGTIIDSGTTVTYLQASAFELVKQALIDWVKLDQVNGTAFDYTLCFNVSSHKKVHFPKFELIFEGGAKLQLKQNQYLDYGDDDETIRCLSMLPSPHMSILGNMLQQNTLVVYDLAQKTISFLPQKKCAK